MMYPIKVFSLLWFSEHFSHLKGPQELNITIFAEALKVTYFFRKYLASAAYSPSIPIDYYFTCHILNSDFQILL